MSHPADHSDPDMDDFAQAEADRDSARQEVATLNAALAESDIRIAGVEAERDHYRVALAEVARERYALRAALESIMNCDRREIVMMGPHGLMRLVAIARNALTDDKYR